MPAAQNVVYDGFSSLLGGMNSSQDPALIPTNQAANLVNCACRGGLVQNRPAQVLQTLTFDSPTSQIAFTTGNFQGAGYYSYPGATEVMFAAVAGRIYRITPLSPVGFYVEDYTPTGDAGNNPNRDRVYMCQADDWFIIQDGQSPAILIQANTTRRAVAQNSEVPIGTFMAYGFGQLWVCLGTNDIVGSDLLGEETNAVIMFTDTSYLDENSNYALPSKFGSITGMAFVDMQDTATGQGPLMVFGKNGVATFNVTIAPTARQSSGFEAEALTNIGALGDRSIVNVNGDLFFRSADGYRSYRQARAEQSLWGHLPASTGVRYYTDLEYSPQLSYGSAIFFNNRVIMTCGPQRCSLYTVHAGLLSLDFDPMASTIGVSTSPPAWDGYWTTPRPVAQLLAGTFLGQKRAFAVTTNLAFNADGSIQTVSNALSEIVEGQYFDDTGTPITSTVQTRAFTCAPAGLDNNQYREKRLTFAELFQINRKGATTAAISFRQNGNAAWNPLNLSGGSQTTATAPTITGDTITDAPVLYTVQNRCDKPLLGGNLSDTRLNERFFDVQFQIVFTGQQQIKKLRLVATIMEDNERSGPT